MRPFHVSALAVLALSFPAAARAGGEPAPDPLVVHEWGTFTSVSGADGTGLEGLQHEEEALPEFVYSRTEVRECPLRRAGFKGLELPANNVTRKMETPVIYVRSRTPRQLRVRVDFQGGLITQWYPVTDLLGPAELGCDDGPLDLKTIERSFLEWDVDVLPAGAERPAIVPDVAGDDPWAYAREVEASWLRTRPRKGPDRMGPVEAERYLFYRGLGTFSLPFRARATEPNGPEFVNGSPHTVAQVVSLEVGPHGATARYDIDSAVDAGEKVRPDLASRSMARIDDVMHGLESDMQKILGGQGLEADEARAMVRTWSRSWFRTEGLRFIYVVPRPLTDLVLPLEITPKPDQLVRVLVGRLELITPQVRAEVERALLDAAGADAAKREAGEARLARLDRFLEPHLREVLALVKDPALKALAEERLAALR